MSTFHSTITNGMAFSTWSHWSGCMLFSITKRRLRSSLSKALPWNWLQKIMSTLLVRLPQYLWNCETTGLWPIQLTYMARKILRAYFHVHTQGSSHLALFLTHRREKRYFLSCCFSTQSHFWTSIKTPLARKYVDPNYFIQRIATQVKS